MLMLVLDDGPPDVCYYLGVKIVAAGRRCLRSVVCVVSTS